MRIDLVVRKLCLCALLGPLFVAGCGDDDDDAGGEVA